MTLHRGAALATPATYSVITARTVAFLAPVPTFVGGTNSRMGMAIALLLLPVVWGAVSHNKILRWVIGGVAATGLSGVVIGLTMRTSGQGWSSTVALSQLLSLSTLASCAILIAWAVSVGGYRATMFCYAAGLLLANLVTSTRLLDNPWKFALSLPVSLILLLLVRSGRRRSGVLILLLLLSLFSLAFSTRSFFVVMLVSALLVLAFRSVGDRLVPYSRAFPLLVGLVVLVFAVGEWISDLSADGVFGPYLQNRTLSSLATTGNGILGNRAEWGGALALLQSHPLGVGVGVTPSSNDWAVAVDGLYMREDQKSNSEVSLYLREGIFDFHSGFWNISIQYSILGMVLVAFVVVILMMAIMRLTLRAEFDLGVRSAIVVVLVATLWDLMFSPLAPWNVGFALGVAAMVLTHVGRRGEPSLSGECRRQAVALSDPALPLPGRRSRLAQP